MGLLETYDSILDRLGKLRKRLKNLALVQGLLTFAIVVFVAGLCFVAIEALFHFGPTSRQILIATALVLLAASFFWFVGRPLLFRFFQLNSPDDVSLALAVGDHFSSVRDRLADALQVFLQRDQGQEGYSKELTDDSLRKVYSEIKQFNFQEVARSDSAVNRLKVFGVTVAALSAICLVFYSDFSSASQRLLNPSRDFTQPGAAFVVEPGDAEVVKGESLQIRAVSAGALPVGAGLFVKDEQAERSERLILNEQVNQALVYTLRDIRSNKTYFVKTDDFTSDTYSITVVEKPFIKTLRLQLKHPPYSRLGTQFLDDNVGDISALPGTRVSFFFQTNKPMVSASVEFDDGTSLQLAASETQLTGSFDIAKSGTYHVSLQDADGLTNDNPIEYHISAIADASPFVQITYPGQDVDLNKNMLLPLTIEAQDDIGLSKLRLGYRLLKGGYAEGPLGYVKVALGVTFSDNALVNYQWDLSAINLEPEDVVSYFAEVFDNDAVTGPKSARSSTFQVRFPSIYEMYEDVESTHREAYEDLEKIFEESKSLQEAVKEIVQEMKRDPDLEWEEKQEINEAAKAQAEAQKQLQDLQQALDEMVDKMEQNDLFSPETLSKYRELQNLIQEMLTPEMQQMLEDLQQSLAELDPQQMKEATEKLLDSQEQFLENMERTLNLLKKLQMEQALDESIRKTQDLKRRQDELNQKTETASGKEEQSKYAEEQKEIKEDADDLAQKLEDLKKQMDEFPQMPSEQVESAQSELQEQVSQKMEQAAQQMQSGQMKSAQQSGQKSSQGLQQAMDSLQQAKDQMTEEEKKRIMQALRQSSHDLLNLSKRQEGLMDETKGSDRNTPGLRDAAQAQQDLLSGLGRVTSQLHELSQSTFFVTPEIGKALGKATKGMQGSQGALESRNPGKSLGNQGAAMSGLNEAVAGLRSSMQGLQGASSGIGFEEMMQRMSGISQQQQGINEGTSQMGEQGGLSMEQQAGMQRLAAEQGAVRKALEQLMRESGNQSDLLGDLDRVSQEMKEVVKDLQRNNASRPTIQRQKRILSRLLDAQRSMQDRDHSQKRKAETGKSYDLASPLALPEALRSKEDRLKNELLRALKENYSKDYKDLIQKYFEALAQKQEAD